MSREIDANGDFTEPIRRRVYGELIYKITPENANEVEAEIQGEMIGLSNQGIGAYYLMVFCFNQATGRVNHYLTRYSNESLWMLCETVRNPRAAWDYYRDHEDEIDSGTVRAMGGLSAKGSASNPTEEAEIWQVSHIGLYHPEFGIDLTSEQTGIVEEDFPEIARMFHPRRHRNRVGRFMGFDFNWDVYRKGLASAGDIFQDKDKFELWQECVYWQGWQEGDFRVDLEKRYQIPWFNPNKPLREANMGDDPVENEIYRIPCMLYALKGQIKEEYWEELATKGWIMGAGVKVLKVRQFLNTRGYQLVIKDLEFRGKHMSMNTHRHPSKTCREMEPVYLDFWENHWMRHYNDADDFIRHLEKAKRLNIILPMSAFEYCQNFENYAIDAMTKFDDKVFMKKKDSESSFTEFDYEKPHYNDKKWMTKVYFADFEATTDEKAHKPYLLCAQGFDLNRSDPWTPAQIYSCWGPGCAQEFLEHLLEQFGMPYPPTKRAVVRVYFFNLKYDFTFLFPHLSEVTKIQKGGKVYSVKACYKNKSKKVYIDFWDALPIFQTSLKNAVKGQLTKEETESLHIKKEVYPYTFYTYELIDKQGEDLWVPIADTQNHFPKEGDYEEFCQNLEEWGPKFKKDSLFNMMEYAIFYCMQDVRCLVAIMKKFGSLLSGQGVEGIYGTPPFSMNLFSFRTASSIGYDYFLRTVIFKQEEGLWVPRHDWAFPKCALRALIQKTVRGGRVMCRDNKKIYYKATCDANLVQDYDAVSLYPTAMSKLWITDGVPCFIKRETTDFSKNKFLEVFAPPEATPEEANQFLYQDGCIHVTYINTVKNRHFPQLCIKDEKTKLNNYVNFDKKEIDTWVNMIDLFNLIDFQNAEFKWDAAVVWSGERHYEIREAIQNLFNFRLQNHCKVTKEDGTVERHEHPIQNVAKLMMNSIFGKSILKPADTEKKIIEEIRWRKNSKGQWENYNNWEDFFGANMYRIKRINPMPGTGKTEVEIYKKDVGASLNIFGSNVLAMARRIIGRVMALAEDVEELHPEMSPGLFYTDTDSMHIRSDLLQLVEKAFLEKYGYEIKGEAMGNFHLDFDPASNFKTGEKTKGAEECWFIAKKLYADKLVGSEGTIGYHMRMKGIPSDLLKYEYYDLIYHDKPFTFDLLENGHISLYYDGGDVCSRRAMKRTIMTKEAREAMKPAAKKRQREEKEEKSQSLIPTESESECDEPLYEVLFPPGPELHQDIIIEDDNTIILPPSAQLEPLNEDEVVDIE